MAESFQPSLQETVLAVLAFDDKYGGLIASQTVPEYFDGVYNEIATAVLTYRRRHNAAPGRAHLEDLFSRAKLDPSDRKTHVLRRTLVNLSMLAEGVNAEYVTNRVQDFVRSQRLKTALLQANDRYLQGGDEAVSEVEGILSGALQFRQHTLDAGTFLSNAAKAFEHTQRQEEFYSLGIRQLDELGIGLIPKQLLMYIAPKSSGKSWMCVNAGRQALLQKAKVVHISLEMDESRVISRYYQSFFGIARKPDSILRTTLELDELDRLSGFRQKKLTPKLNFKDPNLRKILSAKVKHWGARFGRLVIKEFPSGTLTINQLKGYLDYLEMSQQFVPNVLIVDYPQLLKVDADNLRIATGRNMVELRGLASARNLAILAPVQSNRSGIGAKRVSSVNASEDITQVFTADNVLSYSQTAAEQKLGLARLTVEHARDTDTGMQILLTQAYSVGQYVMESAFLNNTYWERLKVASGEGGDDEG